MLFTEVMITLRTLTNSNLRGNLMFQNLILIIKSWILSYEIIGEYKAFVQHQNCMRHTLDVHMSNFHANL